MVLSSPCSPKFAIKVDSPLPRNFDRAKGCRRSLSVFYSQPLNIDTFGFSLNTTKSLYDDKKELDDCQVIR